MCQWIAASFPKLISLKLGRVFAHELVTTPGAAEARRNQMAKDTVDDLDMLQKELDTGNHDEMDDLHNAMTRFAVSRDVLRVEPWVCLKLVHLTMCFVFPLDQETAGWDEQVFQQLSKLDCLESLSLGQSVLIDDPPMHAVNVRGLQLKVQSGLALLTSLMKLATLRFFQTHQNLDEQDLHWILNQWPSLKEITRGLHEDKDISKQLWPLVEAKGVRLQLRSYEFGGVSEEEYEGDEEFDSDFE